MSYCVQFIDDLKGSGMFSTGKILKNDVIFQEEPFVSCQFSWNKVYKYLACDYCMRSLETPTEMCSRLIGVQFNSLPFQEKAPTPIEIVKCSGCEAVYCSEKCRVKAWESYHQVLCRSEGRIDFNGLDNLDQCWREMHFPPESATVMIIVRILAMYKQAASKEKFQAVLNGFCRKTKNEHSSISHHLLGEEFSEKLVVLREQVATLIGDEGMNGWLNLDGFTHFFALLGTNQQGIGCSSIAQWFSNLDETEKSDSLVEQLYAHLEEQAGQFLDCEGVGLYKLQSKLNHSCLPNAEIRFDNGDNVLAVRALKDINEGEEICISYISCCKLDKSRHSRQKYLMEQYLFVCDCLKCEAQADDPDESSSDEDDSDLDENYEFSEEEEFQEKEALEEQILPQPLVEN